MSRLVYEFGGVNNGSPIALSDQVVNSALKYRAQAPLLDSLLKEVGISANDINSLTGSLGDTPPTESGN